MSFECLLKPRSIPKTAANKIDKQLLSEQYGN